MKRYEGLFILKSTTREDGLKDVIDRLSAEITALGGKIETVQKMDKRPFSRVSDKKHSSGFYVNVIFESKPDAVAQLRHRLALNDDLYRVLFTIAPTPKAAAPAAR